ncbi:MAG: DUF5789 family protein [Halodesulfurarchaeum sp.]
MSLRPSNARSVFARKCTFPAHQSDVVETVGDVGISPPVGEPVSVETVLDRSEETWYESPDALHNMVMANLGEDHVGRQYYDDRSPNHGRDRSLSF